MWQWLMDGGHVTITLVSILGFAFGHWWLDRRRTPHALAEFLLLYSFGIAGFKGMTSGFLMHLVWADTLAESIGWPAGNPFQTEIAFANLAFGVLGFLCFWRRDFWLPVLIGGSIFSIGAGITHVVDLVQHGNFAANNAGAILFADFLVPVARIALYLFWRRGLPPVEAAGPQTRPVTG